jgi:membrane associated rhomboid family serine protease
MSYSQIYVPKLSKFNKGLLISAGAIFLLQSILNLNGIYLDRILGLIPEKLLSGHLYTILTYPFVGESFIQFAFDGMMIWFIGSDLEDHWGQKTYIKFFLFSVIGAGLIYSLLGISILSSFKVYFTPLLGLSGFCYSLLFAFALLYPDRILSFMMIFPVKAKYFALLMTGFLLYLGFFSAYKSSSWAHLSAGLTGFLFLRIKSMSFQSKNKVSELKRQANLKKNEGRLKLVKDNEEKTRNPQDPKYWQ